MAKASALRFVPPFLRVCGICEWYYHSEHNGESCAQGSMDEPRTYKSCPAFTLHWDIDVEASHSRKED